MFRQMTIFDFLRPEFPDINDIDEAEAVRIVGEQLGLPFVYNQKFEQWEYKKGRLTLDMEYGHFVPEVDHGALFLGVGYSIRGGEYRGGGSPTSGIKEAVEYFRHAMELYDG